MFFSKTTTNKINKKKIKKIKNNLIVCDFEEWSFEKEILKTINQIKVNKFINVQTNSINYGHNLYTKYKNFNYLSLDEREWQLALRENNLSDLGKILKLNKNTTCSLTKGKKSSVSGKIKVALCLLKKQLIQLAVVMPILPLPQLC